MFVKQLSVFIENRAGRLEQVTEILAGADINILALSMADTQEFGMLRMIVSTPDKALSVMKEKNFSARLTDVLAVRMEDKPGQLHQITHTLCGGGLNIEYMYSLATTGKLAIIVKASSGEKAAEALTKGGLTLYAPEEIGA